MAFIDFAFKISYCYVSKGYVIVMKFHVAWNR